MGNDEGAEERAANRAGADGILRADASKYRTTQSQDVRSAFAGAASALIILVCLWT